MRNGCFFIVFLLLLHLTGYAQRSYTGSSVLASGSWYSIAVKQTGIYKIDVAFLNKLGISTANLPSSSIRVFGNGGAMLPEACIGPKTDDLAEAAIQVTDGGDGIFDRNDYFVFYAGGPDTWLKDSLNRRFKHRKNLYSDRAVYFISIGGTGRRVQAQDSAPVPNTTVNSFSARYFHELDSVNFLNSSKDWYGEEMSGLPGHRLSQAFSLPFDNVVAGQPAVLVASNVARSVAGSSQFNISVNGQPVVYQDIDAVGNSNLDLFAKSVQSASVFNSGNSIALRYDFTPGGQGAEGWIDWFEVFYRRNLVLNNTEQLQFRDWNSVAAGNNAVFTIQQGAGAQVWDVTHANTPVVMKTSTNGSDISFVNEAAALHEYVAFSTGLPAPEAIGKLANQDLHQPQQADMIIVAYPDFLQQALRIAAFHERHDNLKTVTVSTSQVFNEFSSGMPDPVAIRDFVKMYYDRAAGDSAKRPRYLLLLGDASFDYKDRLKNNTNLVPAYENSFSLDPLSTYTSDDFFGFLDDTEDINSGLVTNLLDIGIGRIPAQTAEQAGAYADKLDAYTSTESLGPWRNQLSFIADDQDQNLHLNDAEAITAAAAATNPLFVQDKIYLDAYAQTSTPAGSRYPDVNQAINDQIQQGTLIWNYNGHGSYTRLAEEVVLEKPIVDGWTNGNRLPLFITATCDFAPYDNPAINSLGENILLRNKTGAIALMTTTRLVFAFSNRIMNRNYLQAALQPRANGTYLSLGDAVKQAKNFTYQTQADITNNRKFTLLGDPALTLAYPTYQVATVSINDKPLSAVPDTLKALEKYRIAGNVRNAHGVVQTGFNGTVHATVFDKAQQLSTRGNDADSYPQDFTVQRNQLFKGSVTVINGRFAFDFIVPKDISYQLGNGRISYYAENGRLDGNGSFTGFLIGGSQVLGIDETGPVIKAYLDTESFVNGAVVEPAPLLLLRLSDSSGINIMGTGIGHDISATLDGDEKQSFILNRYFEGDLDSYQEGKIQFQLPALAEGSHTLTIKAWDVANNSSTVTIRFKVVKQGLSISSVINYPNPFSAHTRFRFAHNRPNSGLQVRISIYSISGKLVKTITTTINASGNRSSDIDWPGTNDAGRLLAPGIYVYRLQLTSTTDGETAIKSGRLVRL